MEVNLRTVLAYCNITLDIDKMFDSLEMNDTIVYVKHRDRTKGVHPKPPKVVKTTFRNSLTLYIYVSGKGYTAKYLNVKIPPSAKMEFTGVKNIEQAVDAVDALFQQISPECIQFATRMQCSLFEKEKVHVFLKPIMANMSCKSGVSIVDRVKLDRFINTKTKNWTSLLKVSIGGPCLNIKVPYVSELASDIDFPMWSVVPGVRKEEIRYHEFYESLSGATRQHEDKWMDKKRCSFRVYPKGNVTISGIHEDVYRELFTQLNEYIQQ